MHKLYRKYYTLIEGHERSIFWENFIFTDDDKSTETYEYSSFDCFYDAITQNKLPFMIEHGRTMLFHKPYIHISGHFNFNRTITRRNFVNPTRIEVSYVECSPKVYGYDTFRRNLSMDNFMTFLQERYGSEALAMAMDNTGRS